MALESESFELWYVFPYPYSIAAGKGLPHVVGMKTSLNVYSCAGLPAVAVTAGRMMFTALGAQNVSFWFQLYEPPSVLWE